MQVPCHDQFYLVLLPDEFREYTNARHAGGKLERSESGQFLLDSGGHSQQDIKF